MSPVRRMRGAAVVAAAALAGFVPRSRASRLSDSLEALNLEAEAPEWPRAWAGKLRAQAPVIGEGRFGKVYEATVECDGSKVAVKRVAGGAASADHEAGLLRAFGSSPHFLAYFGHERGRGGGEAPHYIMMELARGGDFTRIIDGLHRVTVEQQYELFYHVLKAVALMHDRGVVHRDLKPENILVSRLCGGDVPCVGKVGDLGDACQAGGAPVFEGVRRCSESTGFLGTPRYLAPETRESLAADPKSDVWSLGLILYELTFVRLPGDGGGRVESPRVQVLRGSDPKIKRLPRGSPIRSLLEGMLAVPLPERLSSAEALRMAAPLGGASAPGPPASLPACFHGGPESPSPEPPKGQVESFLLDGVTTNIMTIVVSYLFSARTVDLETGVVTDPRNKLRYLRSRGYFPRSLALGDRILEVNGRPYTSISRRDQERLKDGLLGHSLNITYERAR